MNLVRYADEFIITANTKEVAVELKVVVSQFLESRGLMLSKEKTKITHIYKGFDFLGWTFRKFKDKLIVKPSKGSIKSMIRKCSTIILKEGKASTQFDDRIMAIKASGYSMAEVEEESGYVTVDYDAIKTKYAELAQKTHVDVERETLAINLDCVSLLNGMENKRPSVEAGFHSYLKRAVVHTHSVYSNILCCSEEGEQIADQIFTHSGLGYIFIPFINPGFTLSMYVKNKVDEYEAANGKYPDIIFMESHGIIASNDDAQKAMEIHDKANDMIGEFFSYIPFPQCGIVSVCESFVSNTPYLQDFIKRFSADEKYFDTTILYPDQLVYLGANLGEKILIDADEGRITYKTSLKQARVIEEVTLGVAYIISEIKRAGLTLKLLCDEGIDFIRTWESEKYRATLVR